MEALQYKTISFAQLREAHQKVKHFLEDESFDKVNSLHTKISHDLRLAGDDIEDLLMKFVQENQLQWGDFEFDTHFYGEGELFSSEAALAVIILTLVNLPGWIFNLISFKRFNLQPIVFPISGRDVSDLNFRQMLTWYIEKDFTGIDNIRYKLKMAA